MSRQLAKIEIPQCELSRVGAEFPEDLDILTWRVIGQRLCDVSACSLWWIGDWVNYGERRYGEKYQEAVTLTEYAMGTLRNAAWVASAVQLSHRCDNLSWSHHREVADLKPAEQKRFLRLAEARGLSVDELRQEIRKDNAEYVEQSTSGHGFSVVRWGLQGVSWFKKQFQDEPITAMSPERRAALRADLKPIVDIYDELGKSL